jgi:2-dehydro-3-deoxy-D-arabinonate dehydratase
MLLYRLPETLAVVTEGRPYRVDRPWDELFNEPRLSEWLAELVATEAADDSLVAALEAPLAPIGLQEVWACGVTYFRSRNARIEESQDAGGGDFYDRVYAAQRPEIFFKASAQRTVGHRQAMHLRRDSRWIVPEPELTLAVSRSGQIVGYTVGNDLSCRDLEGENPLYLPQAKTFARCAAIGPGILVSPTPPPPETRICLRITRERRAVFSDETTLAQLKRTLDELVDFAFRDNTHPHGCFLMTGTGIVPPPEFTLQAGDAVAISIDGIGTLENTVE